LAARAIIAARATAKSVFRDIKDFLFPQQLSVFNLAVRMLVILAGRRGGKTVVAGARLLRGALEHPRSLSLYLALSRESARDIMWPELKAWGERLGIPDACFNDNSMRVTLPNGSRIVVSGTDDTRTIERFRGSKLAGVVIDECGSQPDSLLTALIVDILRPALADLKGYMWLIGTPGLVANGYWYSVSGPERTSNVPLFHWNMLNNPHIPHAAEEMRLVLEENGWTAPANDCEYLGIDVRLDENGEPIPATAGFVREWLGRWCVDVGELVYPYSDALCAVDELPKHNASNGFLYPSDWRFGIGVDVGVVDATAISVIAVHPNDSNDYIVSTELHSTMLTNALADRLRELQLQYPGAPIVIDSGGMGKYHATDVQERYAVSLEAADKREKAAHIRIFRDRMLSGRVKVLRGKCNDAIRDEWTRLPWDKKRLLPKEGCDDHAADSVLYIWRKMRHYTSKDTADAPQFGTKEWQAKQKQMEAARMEAEILQLRQEADEPTSILDRFG
jgi:terminase large subunit-like protein